MYDKVHLYHTRTQMNFKTETSRSETIKAIDKAAQLFKDKLNKKMENL